MIGIAQITAGNHSPLTPLFSNDPPPNNNTDLSVQSGGHGDDVARLTVDGEHVGDGVVWRLGQDAVAHHAVGGGEVVRVAGGHLHDRRAC